MKAIPDILLFAFLAISLLFGCQGQSDKQEESSYSKAGLEHNIDSIANGFLEENKVMGFAIAVIQDNDTLYNKGFGYSDSARAWPVMTDHRFLLASISKLMGATVVMKLVEEGKLALDDTLLDLIPSFPDTSQARKITLRHLLTHTSGLMDYAMEIDTVFIRTGIDPTREDIYRFFATHDLLFDPGTKYAYSNSGYKIMEWIVERATGNSLQKEIDRIINIPSGINLTPIREAQHDILMSDYFEYTGDTIEWRKHWTWISGDGGLTGSPIELANFPFKWSDGTIITKRSFDIMTEPYILKNGIRSDFGIGVRNGTFEGEAMIGHTGGNKSSYAMLGYFPDRKLSIVVMDNTDNSPTNALTIFGHVALAALGKPEPDLESLEDKDSDLSDFTGEFLQAEYLGTTPKSITLVRYSGDNRLYRKRTESQEKGGELIYLGDDTFGYKSFPMDRITFVRNDAGEVVAYRYYWNGLFQRMGFKKGVTL